ncbi:protein S100-P-like [Hyla sarda]|uniref:protein S100-P-like n=1 Tax=Hyla sarda TaxID=327740 RepID=UPI0024C25C8F|nr:protein S100-P-like [Hyla sarda]XP_056411073.1 protein S100-P-like [Hyla sarda]XP_056411074.1 protein S100-P-like [Hyla sarda]XP_056411075.1 protein S100-P-like [Hyla sarda]
MTELETAMALLIDVFDKYASTEGNKNSLTKGELKTMMDKELPGIMGKAKDKDECDKLLKDLDENGDNEVDFNEFIIFVAALTCLGHERFAKMPKK